VAARKAHHRYQDDWGDFVSYLKLFQAYGDTPDKQKFCEERYLDPRVMAEIYNVKTQLEEMVADLNVPITGGGPMAEYLCAVSRGLIHFVCARVGRGTYRSITADRIQIHPGSVMFRENPDFIVAGEIVRTTRMYARSVSPLQKDWLPQISEELNNRLLEAAGYRKRKQKQKAPERDTTWQTKIGGVTFKLQPLKGKKKIAVLPWNDLKEVLRYSEVPLHQQHYNLKGKVLIGKYEVLAGTKIPEIIRITRHVDFEHDRVFDWPRRKTFDSFQGSDTELCDYVDLVLKLAPLKKNAKYLGFLALNANETGQYWFKPSKSFFAAVDNSLASLEQLADQLPQDIDPACMERISAVYAKLSAIYEE
jgi:hypothetical protein